MSPRTTADGSRKELRTGVLMCSAKLMFSVRAWGQNMQAGALGRQPKGIQISTLPNLHQRLSLLATRIVPHVS